MPQLLPQPDPNDEEALIALLSQSLKPQSSQQVLDPFRRAPSGPTKASEPRPGGIQGVLSRTRSIMAEKQIEKQKREPHPNLRVGPAPSTTDRSWQYTMPKSTVAGVGGMIPAGLSGVLGGLLDNPRDPGAALQEGFARFGVAPIQDQPPSLSGELKAHGHDAGPVGGFAIDMAAPDFGDMGLLAGLAMGGIKKIGKAAAKEGVETAASHVDDLASARNALMHEGFAPDAPPAPTLSAPPATVANLAREPRPFNQLMHELLKDPEAVAGGRRLEKSLQEINQRRIPAPPRAPVGAAGAEEPLAALLKPKRGKGVELPYLQRAPIGRDASGAMVVSTRVPEGPNAVASTAPLMTGLDVVKQDPDLLRRMAAEARTYPLITSKQAAMNDEGVIDAFVDTAAQNQSRLIGEMGEHIPRAQQWYVGANQISKDAAVKSGYSPDQTSAVIAVLSPKKDWHQNAELGKRYIDDVKAHWAKDPVFTEEVFDHYRKSATESMTNGTVEKIRKGTLSKRDAQRLIREFPHVLNLEAGQMVGRPWSALPVEGQARFLRAHDELTRPRDYPILTPEGGISHMATIKGGKAGSMSPQAYDNVEKVVQLLNPNLDPNELPEMISKMLGNNHKVRSFFDNINSPHFMTPEGFGPSTIDTHWVGGSHLRPLGLTSPIVKKTMGGLDSKPLGVTGMNPLYQEATVRAAREHGLEARGGQSVGWEGVKGLFSPAMKRDKLFIPKMDAVWAEYRAGRLSLKDAQNAIFNIAAPSGLTTPEWARAR